MRVATQSHTADLRECMQMRSPSSSSTEGVYTPPAPSSPSAVHRADRLLSINTSSSTEGTPTTPCSPSSIHCHRTDPLLNIKLNHARQTVDFVQRNLQVHAPLDKASMTVWQAFDLIPHTLPMALSVAEACRSAYPTQPWLHLVALMAPLGNLLMLPAWGSQPSWVVGVESFPVGCRFSSKIADHQYFSVNPDRRNRTYATDLGIYAANCGLGAVYMSWSESEYLHMVLALNATALPHEALFLARHQHHGALLRGGYRQFLDARDEASLVWLVRFAQLQQSCDGATVDGNVRAYYDSLIAQFFPNNADGVLHW